MSEYLDEFYNKIKKKWKGSLIRVNYVKEKNAKEYLNKLAKAGSIERIKWGWYWVPDDIKDVWDFFGKDKNFKIISSQTAASFWNYDFLHRDTYVIKVKNKSYGKALQEFGERKGWNIKVEVMKRPVKYVKIGKLFIENVEESIIDCLQNWAFTDAFAVLYENRAKINAEILLKKGYWKRISGTNVRVRQALEYGSYKFNELSGKNLFPSKEIRLKDDFVRREIEDAVEKVVEFA
jgi:hypothetical protein